MHTVSDVERDAGVFLETLYGIGPDDGLLIAISTFKPFRQEFCPDVGAALTHVVGHADIYSRITLLAERPRGRGLESDSAALPGVWCEFDVKGSPNGRGGVHDDGFGSVEQAADLADRVLTPTMLVRSGYGLHAYWLFYELLRLESDRARTEAKALVQAWQAQLRRLATAEFGVSKLDSTHDLSRVFRPVGSFNSKGNVPELVTLEAHSGARYSLDELSAHIEQVDPQDEDLHRQNHGARRPQLEILERLPKLGRIARHEGKSPGDGTGHAWDHYLACEGIRCGLSDLELEDLIVDSRRRFGDPQGKAERPDYVANTITAAHHSVNFSAGNGRPSTSSASAAAGSSPAEIGRWISEQWQLEPSIVGGWSEGAGDAAIIWLKLADDRELRFPRLADFFNPALHVQRVSVVARCPCPSLKKEQAIRIAQQIIALCDAQDDPDADARELAGWLHTFIRNLGTISPGELREPGSERWEALCRVRDFRPDPEIYRDIAPRTAAIRDAEGHLWLPADALMRHIRYLERERIDWNTLNARMEDLGWRRHSFRQWEPEKDRKDADRIQMSFFAEVEPDKRDWASGP
jgi:hypothetical protein